MGAEPRTRGFTGQVEKHQKEQIEHKNRTGIDDHLNRRQELSAYKQEDARDVQEEGKDPQHAGDWILASYGQNGARDASRRQIIEAALNGKTWIKRGTCH